MKTQRLRIAALVLAAALCSAACSTTEPAANGSSPGEMPAIMNANTSGTGVGQPARGSDVAAQGAATPQTRPFLVLISGPNCQYCNPLSDEMEKLRGAGAARMDFYVFDVSEGSYVKAVADAGQLGVTIKDDSLNIDRTKKLPWAAVFVPGNQGPSAQKPFVNGVTTGAEFEAAVKTLQTGVEAAQQRTPTPERAGASPEETARLTEARLDERLKALKSELATDSGFQQTLLTNDGFKKKLAEDPAFRESLLKDPAFKERLAQDTGFRAGLSLPPADSLGLKTVLSYAALGLFPLLALGAGGWGFWKARGVDLKLRQEVSRTAAWESRWRERTRRSRGALSRVIRKLRADVKHIGERVDTAAGARSGVAANDDPREAARVVLNDVVSALAEPRSGQHSPETVATATKLWGIIDASIAPIRLRLGVQTDEPNRGAPSHVETTPAGDWVTREGLKGELDRESRMLSRKIDTVGSTLSRKIEGVDKALTNELESVRAALIDKIETEIDAVRIDFGVNSAQGGKTVTVEENGHGGEAVKIQAPAAFVPQRDVAVAPQEDERAAQPGTGEPERPEENAPWPSDEGPAYAALLLEESERVEAQAAALGALELRVKSLEESPARTSPEVEALVGEIHDLGERLRTEGLEYRQALDGRIEKLERRLRKSRSQMLNLWKRLRQKLDGHAKQTLLSLRGLSKSFTERLEQQHEDDGRRLDKLDHSLKGLWDEWQPGQLSLANVQDLARVTSQTVAEVVGRLVAGHEAKMAEGLPANDRGRAESACALESHRKQLHEIAAKVGPLVQTMGGLTEVASSSRKLAPENKSKLSEFLDEIAKFDRLERAAVHQLEALRRNSVRSLYEKFQGERGELEARFRGGAITAEGFARGGLALLETYAPEADPADGRPAGAGGEVLERYAAGAEDRLMDWYSDFFQLYTRLQEARRAGGDVDDDVLREMSRALKVAREVLSRFDIQPEEIVIGQTLYDGRLHDFALTRESSHPTHTIIEVWKSGFHRMRDGETIRRPKVVVSGTGAGSGAV